MDLRQKDILSKSGVYAPILDRSEAKHNAKTHRLTLFFSFDDELGPASAKNVFGEYSVNVATFVAMGDEIPRRFLPRLLFAGC